MIGRTVVALAGLLLCFPAAAQSLPAAQTPQAGMPGGSAMPSSPGGSAPPSSPGGASASPEAVANRAAMTRMHDAMMATPVTGDADRDFVGGMIPHHEGAIAMAGVEKRYGRDPALRALARRILADQKREVAEMRRWQAAHPAR